MAIPCRDNMKRGECDLLAITRPHQDISDQELTGIHQEVTFNIAQMTCPENPKEPCSVCEDSDSTICKFRFMINNRPFNKTNIRKLELGTASKWTLDSDHENHPFHIHVNPFQVTRKNPDDEDEIVWRDTLLVREGEPVTIRSRYERYIGQFVIHCHILDHEDQGMMQIVEVELPSSSSSH